MPDDAPAMQVFVELTRACNFACSFCPHPRVTRAPGTLSLGALTRALAQLKSLPRVDYVMFSNLGEPLLHPDFAAACRLVREAGFTLIVTTNGVLLDERHKNALPVDRWYISYRSTSAGAFAHRAARVSHEIYARKIAAFVQDNSQPVTLYLMGNDSWFNREATFADAVDLTDRRALEECLNREARRFCPEFAGVRRAQALVEAHIPLRPRLSLYVSRTCNWANRLLPAGYAVRPHEPAACRHGYHERHLTLFWNGDLSTCCLDYDGELTIGNLLAEPLDVLLHRRASCGSRGLCRDCAGTVVRDASRAQPSGREQRRAIATHGA